MTENDVQKSIVDYLNAVLLPTHRVFAIPNAARRGKGRRAANAVPGLRRGVPDLAVAGHGKIYFLEVKRNAEATLSDAQEEWGDWCALYGNPWARVESVEQVRVALQLWRIDTREAKV